VNTIIFDLLEVFMHVVNLSYANYRDVRYAMYVCLLMVWLSR